ncbi:MAG TPA: AmmeMemoRadiSam system protein A [Candidatus Bathyarchaeia archaeon]|nr:AmmeMemoRadiSam system protein A [Candidatus Bathyarchaeia archaeon]
MNKKNKDPYRRLAREAISQYLQSHQIISIPASLPGEMTRKRSGVFVSIHRKDGTLRGCIGTILPIQRNIAEEIIANAIGAATQDPRFPAVSSNELPKLDISVDVLSEPQPVTQNFRIGNRRPEILDPRKYGLIVTGQGGRKGLLLPDIPEVNSASEQIKICYQKAGLFPHETVKLEIFKVERHQNHQV